VDGSKQPTGELSDDDKAAIDRRLFAAGELSEIAMTDVALEALERADVEFFLTLTNRTRQSEDPEVLSRTSLLLDTYADMAADLTPEAP
jgi:hypothetical protein